MGGALLDLGPSLKGIATAIDNAAKTIKDPTSTRPLEDVAKDLVINIAKALNPNANPDLTINKLVNNGIDQKTELALGAYMAIFKMGLDMSFSGVPGFDQKRDFKQMLFNYLAPQGMQDLQQASITAGLGDIFRPWRN